MVTYNVTSLLANVTSLNQLVSIANTATNGLLVGFFMITLWLVLLVSFLRFDFVKALASSSFVCFVLSAFLVYLDYLNILFMLGFLILTSVGGLILYLSED